MSSNSTKKYLIIILMVMFVAGCSSSGIQVRGYVEDKARVDQEMSGNAGYLLGSAPDEGPRKMTRKVFVVEVTQEAKDVSHKIIREDLEDEGQDVSRSERRSSQSSFEDDLDEMAYPPDITMPSFDDIDDEEDSLEPASFVEYTIEKDDTLQKISKKFYGSFSKWPRIYQANEDLIDDPNHIKPGIVIRVPMD